MKRRERAREHKSKRKPTFAERENLLEAEREAFRKKIDEPGQKNSDIDSLSRVKSGLKAYTTPTHIFATLILVF